ncbi:MAG: SDR family oxidoreductase [Pseudomonadota bacterium]|jgi:short-subunit dehydrogenase|nr:SDR family NAD(P)-dependent oxidoreductase [Sphingomonas sp.]MDQ3482276.1 SDR family oxidoreductase [Pseudomonadota bacterium]
MKQKPIQKQTIVITGGSSGIGLATAKMAAERGANVIILSRDEEGMRKICDEERAAGHKLDYVVADIGERDQVRDAVQTVISRHGGFDTWYNCAGVGVYAKLEDVSDADHEKVFKTNYWGVVYGSLEALKHLKKNGGTLINQGSIASDMPAPVLGTYTATKHAVKGFTDSLRQELIEEGAPVYVSLIKPAGIHTPFGEHAKNEMGAAAVVPPPLYAPEVVATAVLDAAQKPIREVIIGGSGRGMTWIQKYMPRIADQLFSRAFPMLATDESHPPRQREGGFFKPGKSGNMYGDQDTFMLKSSVYTSSQTRPAKTLATVAAVGVGAAALTGWLLRPKAQGDQKPNKAVSGDRPSSVI